MNTRLTRRSTWFPNAPNSNQTSFESPGLELSGYDDDHIQKVQGRDSPGHELSEYVAKVCLKATNDVTDPVKGQIFDYLPSLASQDKIAAAD